MLKAYVFYQAGIGSANRVSLITYISNLGNAASSGGSESGNKLPTLNIGLGFSPSPNPGNEQLPNAYLKYILYDEQEQPIQADFVPVTEQTEGGWQELTLLIFAR